MLFKDIKVDRGVMQFLISQVRPKHPGISSAAQLAFNNISRKEEIRALPEQEFDVFGMESIICGVRLKPRHWRLRLEGFVGEFHPGIRLKSAFEYTASELCSTLGKKEMRVLEARSWRYLKGKVPSAQWTF